MENKRDLSTSMARANIVATCLIIPVAIIQMGLFILIHGSERLQLTRDLGLLFLAVVLGIPLHEWIHAVAWMIFGRKLFSAIKFGFHWKTFTPYAHLNEPIEVGAYRIAAFMPGFMLGILPYIFSLCLGDSDLFWFSLVHTASAAGDWLILWLIRDVKTGMQVEDHPGNVECYVLEL